MGNRKYTEEQWHDITNANCIDVAARLGYEFDDKRSDSKSLHIANNGGLFVWRDGTGWYQHSTSMRGHAVELVQDTLACSYAKALDWIYENVLGKPPVHIEFSNTTKAEPESSVFSLPEKAPTQRRLFAYLIKSRCIDSEIVGEMVKKHQIYQEKAHGNICFLGYDKDEIVRYCSTRGTLTGEAYRGEIACSNKEYAFKMLGTSNKLYIFEAAIDALSHASLFKMSGRNWREDTRLAMGGCCFDTVERALKDYKFEQLYICTDNDKKGHKMAAALQEHFGSKSISRLTPVAKDWNDDLTNIHRVAQAEKTNIWRKAMDLYYKTSGEIMNELTPEVEDEAVIE